MIRSSASETQTASMTEPLPANKAERLLQKAVLGSKEYPGGRVRKFV
jgi:hypothetical protein